jgi:hypothetical protein
VKRLFLLLAPLVLAGCTTANGPSPAPKDSTPMPEKPTQTEPGTVALPKENEVCLKPEDQSGILFHLYKPQGDSTFRAKPGWTIARPAYELLGAVSFPKPVDRSSVKLRVEPAADWVYQERPTIGAPETLAPFDFVPAGAKPNSVTWGKPGWITLTVESAKAKDGSDLVTKPLSLRIFAYDEAHQLPYLVSCYTSLGVPVAP